MTLHFHFQELATGGGGAVGVHPCLHGNIEKKKIGQYSLWIEVSVSASLIFVIQSLSLFFHKNAVCFFSDRSVASIGGFNSLFRENLEKKMKEHGV